MNAEDGFEVPILAILCDGRDFYFFKYEANMHAGCALPIFARGAFGGNTTHTILSVPDLARQSNPEDFVGNVRRLSEVLYYVFMNGYISGLEACWKCDSSKGTAEGRSQSSAPSWHNALVTAKSALEQAMLACSKREQDKAEESEILAKKAHELLKERYVSWAAQKILSQKD